MANAQEVVEEKIDDKKVPEISFDKTTHDYGTLKKGGNGECEFTFYYHVFFTLSHHGGIMGGSLRVLLD